MVTMEITSKNTGKTVNVEFFNTFREARQRAIRLTGYAGYLNFLRDADGDSKAENNKFVVDLTA